MERGFTVLGVVVRFVRQSTMTSSHFLPKRSLWAMQQKATRKEERSRSEMTFSLFGSAPEGHRATIMGIISLLLHLSAFGAARNRHPNCWALLCALA